MKVDPIRDPEKLKEFERHLAELNLEYATLWGILLNFCLRVSDGVTLKVKDVRNPDDTIKDVFRLKEQKNGFSRRITINKSAKKILRHYFNQYDLKQDDWLFPSQKGGHLSTKAPTPYIKKAAKKAKIEDNINTHSARKTFGYHAYRHYGYTLLALQAKYGHKNPDYTRVYIGDVDDEVEEMEREVTLGGNFAEVDPSNQ